MNSLYVNRSVYCCLNDQTLIVRELLMDLLVRNPRLVFIIHVEKYKAFFVQFCTNINVFVQFYRLLQYTVYNSQKPSEIQKSILEI